MSARAEHLGATIPAAAGIHPSAIPAAPLETDWPHTTRLLPWMLAGFITVLWLVPFDAIDLPGNLPVDTKLDRVLLIPMVLFWMTCLTAAAGPRLRRSPLNVVFVLFLGVAVASVLLNAETLSRLGELELAIKKLALLFSFIAFAYVSATSIRPTEVWAFARLIVVLGSISALGLIYEYRTGTNVFYDWTRELLGGFATVAPEPGDPTFGRENNTGPTTHALAIATMLAMALPFAFAGLFRSRERRERIFYGIAIVLLLAGSASTVRKTGAVAPAVALLVVFLYQPARMVRLLPFGVVVLVLMQGLAPGAAVRVKAQFVNGSLTSSPSSEGRTDDYDATAPDVDKYVAFGRGYGTYDADKYRYLDNQYLKQTIETGYVGLAALILLVIVAAAVGHGPARSGHRLRGPPAMAAVAAILVFGATSTLFDSLAFPHVPYLFALMVALAMVLASDTSPAVAAPPRAGGHKRRRAVLEVTVGMIRYQSTLEPALSVIVVTHNGREQALRTLRSARSRMGNVSSEWFVVDSGSSDGTPDAIASEWSDIRVIRRPNIGFAAANNVALQQATGRYVLLLNPDVEIEVGELDEIIALLDQRPDVGAASVFQVDAEGAPLPSVRRFPSPARKLGEAFGVGRFIGLAEEVRPGRGYKQERDADWVVGAFLMVRRRALDEVGPLDERFFMYSEEADLCRRLHDAGWRIRHLPAMTVMHRCGGYSKPELRAQLSWSKLLFARKHYGRVKSGGIRAALILGHVLRVGLLAAPAGFNSRVRGRMRGEMLALRMLMRPRRRAKA